ncbi:cobaltochelatase subunit CobN [Neptunomonas marina]|uniref:Cobaltochelatase subunit CobN n=1 Tax=Neptunomonas marina TaxID=1815562 RepID=A0A437Q4A8_9GAMM|nr:cobaltochelatase subunit CobN [Neptunomonas marina]RVU29311.1 cobaltochelatase subunit CobN [Neptunomonas marina]
MHLLAAQPGGYVEDEGIIDLAQTPAPVVILGAADSAISALAHAIDRCDTPLPEVRLANWLQLAKPAAFDLYEHRVLEHAHVVLLSLLGGRSYWAYGLERLMAWAKQANRTLIIVPGDDQPDPELAAASTVSAADQRQVWQYLRAGGVANANALLHFLAGNYLGYHTTWEQPQPLPACMLLAPDASTLSPTSLSQWQSTWHTEQPVAVLLLYRSHLQSGNTDVFYGLVACLRDAGLNPLPVAISSLKEPDALAAVDLLIEQSGASVILNCTGFSSNRAAAPGLASTGTVFSSPFAAQIPVVQLVMASTTQEDWQDHSQGLRSRDIAMQVVLPEMDGRILSRAACFKTSTWRCTAAQTDVVRFELHPERAAFVCGFVARTASLANKANRDKRVALVLANYPTHDGRIGNGVGLDTPAATINILRALQAQGYPVDDIPEGGDALIRALLQSITNNPNTLHYLPCWQSMAIDEYMAHFAQLPDACQQAVWERWGAPEQDHKCRNGRLMIAGIRLGETFVGIQPARGFNLDLAANYHDPDLIPPHSYLAFYFWLRHTYQVDAFIHVGKHGNLEWLPGKGVALSEQCWPDIALGPMPNFYPFIVNDPGEGAQAKRRTQAVIIDHLMPPMTRAETYGEMAELEGLVDELYQAMGMDPQREQWLKEAILETLQSSHLLEEIAPDGGQGEALLDSLDAYLCEIKESQIRNGLHILGELPSKEKLADTLVALLRLPRGSASHEQGILHALASDLALDIDPFGEPQMPYHGPKPQRLAQVAAEVWRNVGDTRERLEQLAQQLVIDIVLEQNTADTLSNLPVTAELLEHAKTGVLQLLEQSAEHEISTLLTGLNGGFVPPGPSGAPTRGRLDTLPTGRNFFSVDNRAVPTKAAWALGQKSADALIMRHLQEHGDYPKQLGLSVWGTATMRTGGDDIAQAFALMGVTPVWAEQGNRIIDIKVIPAMLMARPRVDVTLRISGFFRDAFPNVIKLYDTAVQAIAQLDEPGTSNVIRQHIEARAAELSAQGIAPDTAQRQASYRVFGSKPGAYGAGLQGLIDEKCWDSRADLAEAYVNWGGYAYGHNAEGGVVARDAFIERLRHLEVVVQNQDNREHDLLDSDDYYQFQGGMTVATAALRGQEPVVYFSDHANPERPHIRTLKEELNRVMRSRVLNPKWHAAMRDHGYKGAFEMAATLDYLFAYDATTTLVGDYQYDQICDALLLDETNRDFMLQSNAPAFEKMIERLSEAHERNMWSDSNERLDALKDTLLALDEQQEKS